MGLVQRLRRRLGGLENRLFDKESGRFFEKSGAKTFTMLGLSL
jgi:hypothetical protein